MNVSHFGHTLSLLFKLLKIRSVFLTKMFEIVATGPPDVIFQGQNAPNSNSAGASPQSPSES